MKRRFEGLHQTSSSGEDLPEGLFLVCIQRVQYRWHGQKPYYSLWLSVVEPKRNAGASIKSRLYCTTKALWKLNWFLRDFGYNLDLLGQDEVDETDLVGLKGVVKISRVIVHGASFVRLDGFAPASQWEELSMSAPSSTPEVA